MKTRLISFNISLVFYYERARFSKQHEIFLNIAKELKRKCKNMFLKSRKVIPLAQSVICFIEIKSNTIGCF